MKSITCSGRIYCLAYSSDSQQLGIGCRTGEVQILDTDKAEVLFEEQRGDGVLCLNFSPSGKEIAIGGYSTLLTPTAAILHPSGGGMETVLCSPQTVEIETRAEPQFQVGAVACSRDGRLYAMACTQVRHPGIFGLRHGSHLLHNFHFIRKSWLGVKKIFGLMSALWRLTATSRTMWI